MEREEVSIIGQRVKKARKDAGLTLDAIARKIGLSKSHLSRFERGQKALSVAALLRLSDELGVPISAILSDEVQERDLSIRRSSKLEHKPISDKLDGPAFAMLRGGNDTGSLQLIHLKVPANQRTPEPAHHHGREGLFVTVGAVYLTAEGSNACLLKAGDFAEFDASRNHIIEGTDLDSELLLMVLPH